MRNRIKELLFQNKSPRQTIAKNVFWLSFSQLGSRLIRSFLIIYAARLLGTSEFGVFSYALGVAGFFMTFADIGINPLLTRNVARHPNEQHAYFSVSFFLKAFLLILTASLILFVAPHFSKIEGAILLIPFIAILAVFDGIREFAIAFFRAKEKMELEALVSMLTNVSITVFGFWILGRSATAHDFTISYALSAGTGVVVALFLLRKEFRLIFSSFQKRLLRPIIADALPTAFVSLIGMFMLNVDIMVLGWLKTASEVGFYSSGQRIVQLLYTIPAILASSIFPALSRFAGEKNTNAIQTLTEQSLTTVFMFSLPLTIGGVVLAGPIIHFLYGAGYAPAT
ncbi:MAG: flippase, partial [Candidatus Wolfebacteria bacterium]|nr:flippase [Candidatus Wolfebacteria bacterium]